MRASISRILFLIGSLTLSMYSPAHAQSAEQRRAAQKMFEAGDELYESGRFDEAAEAFRASYDLVKSPNSRLMLARSLRDQGDRNASLLEYQGTIDDAMASQGRYPEALAAATAEMEALRAEGCRLSLADGHPPLTEVRLDGRVTTLDQNRSIGLNAGQHTLELVYSDGKRETRRIELAPGQSLVVEPPAATSPTEEKSGPRTLTSSPSSILQAAPQPQRERTSPWRTAAYVSAGVGAAGLATFGVFAVLDRSTYKKLEDSCTDGCSEADTDRIDKGRRYQLLANIGLAVGAVGIASGVSLYLFAPAKSPVEDHATLRLEPGRLVLRGRF